MGRKSYVIVTNNPMVLERLGDTHNVEYADISYEGVLERVRDKIHLGHTLLSHPFSYTLSTASKKAITLTISSVLQSMSIGYWYSIMITLSFS